MNGAVVIGDQAMNDGQAEAGATLERAAKRLKDRIDFIGGNPAAVILDGENHTVIPAGFIETDRGIQAAAIGHRSKPVRRQVPHDLADLILVASQTTGSSGTSTSMT
jgi:hypothetical protein